MNKAITFESLSRSAKELSAQVIMETADLVFLLWPDGEIAEASFGERARPHVMSDALKGRRIEDIATPEDTGLLSSLIDSARRGHRPAPIKVHHSDLIKQGHVARYSAHLAGDGKNVVLIGSSLSSEMSLAEQAVNAEIARYQQTDRRSAEVRYQALFASSTEGLLIVDDTGLIEEANPNASDLLEEAPEDLIGAPLTTLFDSAQTQELAQFPKTGWSLSDTLEFTTRLRSTGTELRVSCKAVRSLQRSTLIVRLNACEVPENDTTGQTDVPAVALLHNTSVPILLTDRAGVATWANGAFSALLKSENVIGEQISDLLGVSPFAIDVAFQEADQHGRILTSLGALDGRLDIPGDAHVWLVSVPPEDPSGYGLVIRHAPQDGEDQEREEPPESSALADLVGQAPMKKLVRSSTALLERNCIEAALRLTGNNRAAAAHVLGLSRQSLYLKLRQHKLV